VNGEARKAVREAPKVMLCLTNRGRPLCVTVICWPKSEVRNAASSRGWALKEKRGSVRDGSDGPILVRWWAPKPP